MLRRKAFLFFTFAPSRYKRIILYSRIPKSRNPSRQNCFNTFSIKKLLEFSNSKSPIQVRAACLGSNCSKFGEFPALQIPFFAQIKVRKTNKLYTQ